MKINSSYSKILLLLGLIGCNVSLLVAGNALVALKFGNGLTISDADSTMSLNFGIMMQNRIDVYKVFEKNSKPTTTFMLRRLRLKFKGSFLSQKLNYKIQLSLSPNDVKTGNVLLDGFINYRPIKQFSFQFGQAKLPADREGMVPDEYQSFIDESTTNNLFRLDRDFGFQFFGNFGRKFIFKPTFSIASGEGRNYTAIDVQHLDYTTKIEFLPTGEFANNGEYSMQDFVREPKPKIAIAFAYDFNNKPSLQKSQNGGNYIADSLRKNVHTIYANAILKYKGATTTVGYIFRKSVNNVIYLAGQSFYIGTSYLFKKKVEIGARFNRSFSGKIGNINTINEYTFGISYYVFKNAFKLQTNYNLIDNKTTNTLSGNWCFQAQFAF